MRNLKKVIASVLAVSSVVFGMAGISADATTNANKITESNVATFEWDASHAKIINLTTTSRYMIADIEVYSDITGSYVTNCFSSNTGSYGTYAQANNTKYSSSGYNFRCWGELYNSTVTTAGVYWSSGNWDLD